MALPMLKGLIAKSAGKMPTNLEDKFKVLVDGSVLRIRLSFTAEELLAYQKTKAAGKTASAAERRWRSWTTSHGRDACVLWSDRHTSGTARP